MEAQRGDPAGGTYYVDQRGRLTAGSRREWRRKSEDAIRSWMRAQKGIDEMRTIQKELTDKGSSDFQAAVVGALDDLEQGRRP